MLEVDKYEVAKGIKSLIEKGYVFKEKDLNDKRKCRLYPTEKANNIRNEFIEILKQSSEILTKGFTEEEKNIALRILIKMSENMFEEVQNIKKS